MGLRGSGVVRVRLAAVRSGRIHRCDRLALVLRKTGAANLRGTPRLVTVFLRRLRQRFSSRGFLGRRAVHSPRGGPSLSHGVCALAAVELTLLAHHGRLEVMLEKL